MNNDNMVNKISRTRWRHHRWQRAYWCLNGQTEVHNEKHHWKNDTSTAEASQQRQQAGQGRMLRARTKKRTKSIYYVTMMRFKWRWEFFPQARAKLVPVMKMALVDVMGDGSDATFNTKSYVKIVSNLEALLLKLLLVTATNLIYRDIFEKYYLFDMIELIYVSIAREETMLFTSQLNCVMSATLSFYKTKEVQDIGILWTSSMIIF